MDKKQRDVLVAGILVVGCAALLYKNVLHKGKPAPKTATAVAQPSPEDSSILVRIRDGEKALKQQSSKWEGDWQRDPFQPQAAVSAAPAGEARDFVLKGIFWDETNPKAVVNDHMLATGDMIDGYKLMEIHPRSVVLREGEKNVKLSIFSSSFSEASPPAASAKAASN